MVSPVGFWRLTEAKTPRFLAMMKGVGGGFSSWCLASHRGTNAAIFGNEEGSRQWASPVSVGRLT